MSFILDALKKADEARHPTALSSLGKIRVPRLTPRHARWPWVVGGAALLAVNAGVIAYVVWPKAVSVTAPARDSRPATAAVSPVASARPPEASLPARPSGPVAAVPPAEPPPAAPVAPVRARAENIAPAEPVKPIERSPVPAEPTKRIERSPVPTPPDVRGTLAAPPPTRVTPPPASPSSQAPPRQPPVPPVPPAPSSAASGAPPTVATMPPSVPAASPRQPSVEPPRAEPTRPAMTTPGPATPAGGADEISKLKLTVHVWSDKPAERLVFINGRKYVQGDRIEDKVLLEEITPEGAAVSYQGRRSLLRP
jgi:general secretion pathway protein B